MTAREPRGVGLTFVREINAVTTLRVLHEGGAMTLTNLVEATGLARRTVEGAVDRLLAEGLAVEQPPSPAERAVGRPARSFRFRADAGHVVGLDIGLYHVTALLADLRGDIRARAEVAVPRAAGRHERLAAAAAAVEQCRARTHIAPEDVWATTAGTPGVVEDSAYLSVCHVVPDWSDFSLAQALGAHLPGPVQVENDANLSAIAERWRGVAHGVDSMVWVLTGRRIRAAILINGLLYRGANGAAGEIGWLPELGWAELSEQPLSFGGADGTRAGEAAATTIGRAAAGDEHSRMEIDRYAAGLAPGLTALTLALNPQCLVIGGAVAAVGDTLLRALAGHMGKHSLRLPELRTSALDRDAVGLGAVRHSLDQVEARLFSTDRSGARPTAVG